MRFVPKKFGNTISPGWFRLFLAVVVVFYHTSKIVFFGYWAVFVFFVLSGFWLQEMYSNKYSSLPHPVTTFYLSRFLRVYPVFAACTLLAMAVNAVIHTPVTPELDSWRQWLPLGYSMMPHKLLWPAWSLDIELQFYLLFPLAFFCLMDWTNGFRILGTLAILMVGLWQFGAPNSLATYGGFFLSGMLISRFAWSPTDAVVRSSAACIGFILAAVFLVPEIRSSVLLDGTVKFGSVDMTRIVDVLGALLTIPFIAKNVRVADTNFGRHAGNLSFPLYLIHWVTLGPYTTWSRGLPMLEKLACFGVYFFVTAVLTLAVYIVVDRPFEKFRRSLTRYVALATTARASDLARRGSTS
jgi:peptidoglycan/LPS O-acetylase OafA/YrhL